MLLYNIYMVIYSSLFNLSFSACLCTLSHIHLWNVFTMVFLHLATPMGLHCDFTVIILVIWGNKIGFSNKLLNDDSLCCLFLF